MLLERRRPAAKLTRASGKGRRFLPKRQALRLPIRTPRKPVKIYFVCMHGVSSEISAWALLGFLKERNIDRFFKITFAGIQFGDISIVSRGGKGIECSYRDAGLEAKSNDIIVVPLGYPEAHPKLFRWIPKNKLFKFDLTRETDNELERLFAFVGNRFRLAEAGKRGGIRKV